MADDVNPALRAELEAALAVIEPQIRGLHDLMTVSITEELRAEIEAQIEVRERRANLIQAVLDQLDATNAAQAALEADGYPTLLNAELPPGLFTELQGEETDLDAAVAVFEKAGPATTVTIELGEPAEKPL